MKLTTLIIVTFLLTTQVMAQPVQKIKQLCKNKKFVPLNSYVDKLDKGNVKFWWETLRTIVSDYQEGIIKIEESTPANDGTGASFITDYRVYVLADKSNILYYRFTKDEATIDSLKDAAAYASFCNAFKQAYGDTLHQDDLFLTSIVYGRHCGIAGVDPEYMKQLNVLLLDNNVDVIRQWLRSANAEKQLYALKGYRILVHQGYQLTEEEKRIIAIVEQKKGSVNTCSGCIYMNQLFQWVVSSINSIPPEDLQPEKPRTPEPVVKKKETLLQENASYWWSPMLGVTAVLAVVFFMLWRKRSSV